MNKKWKQNHKMKKIFLLLILTLQLLLAQNNYENYEPQKFFEASSVNAFFSNETGELLKKIMVNGNEYLMQEDGDLFDEDVATIDETILSLKGERFSFGKSKRLLATKVYPSHQKAFYSNCDYTIKEKKLVPLHESCGFKYRKNKNRSERIEWEHVVPAWHFGHQLRCWQNGGRMTCRNTNSKFKQMEADMHNLVPAIGEINGDRSNYKFAMIEGEKRAYGKVNVEIEFASKKAEPKESIFGDIARTYFYMRDRYGLRISKTQEKMFIAWNNMDPANRWEKKKNQLIKELQGDENLYITNYKKIDQLGAMTEEIASTDYENIKLELAEKYGFIFEKLSAPLAGGLLVIMTLFVMYRRKKNQRVEVEKEKVEKEEPMHTKSFQFISKLGDVAISINDTDEIIIEKSDKNNLNQCWLLSKANKSKEYFFIENEATGKVIEISEANSNDGARIILNKKKSRNNDHQEWSFESSNDKGYVFVVSKWAFNVLDVKYKKTNDGTKLQSFHKKVRGTENQEWRVETV
ncbi:MAG: Endonuclease I precursor (EC @ Extracellular deoxyribonuclease Dns (EC [uncultured Sulfurovum sp.]|uniref:Endonuclease I ) n=1 Tax=uncultured Sulfurovum sp. TaxID=269237 RepID=A0A6S6S7M4_9BACT|nr:MAG: Endonuclease I precursor (EC @ Extracellular deoxyribonuclease Dns (EC [uncultured Sulfurovum sp.]